ncbi:response regulator transcription factor [Sphaerisporangium fuscum]|uniref:response regulator transcription factor n=1 Tax=Sphaerisporangium fuscum TaxID=2835868 RepID=UPI003556F2DD
MTRGGDGRAAAAATGTIQAGSGEAVAQVGGKAGFKFVEAVREIAAGGTVIDPDVVHQLLVHRRAHDPLDALTPREREVLALVAEGRSNSAIAQRLHVSEAAVAKHISGVHIKLDLGPDADDHRRVLAALTFLRSR